jgi:hypothetical protein
MVNENLNSNKKQTKNKTIITHFDKGYEKRRK